jgi:acyl carrier protein
VGGEGVCLGYLNRPELTEEKFVENPYIKGDRLYRSGDMGRYLGSGDIEYLGRLDQQVQIRGYRVEPAEIEARLMESRMIREAVVIPLEDNKSLCAYIVPFSLDSTSTSLVSQLKEWLLLRLPEYMIPAYFVRLDRIPLTPNGKVDRKGLPAPEPTAYTAVYVPPRDEQEEKLTALWSEVLNIKKEKISIDANFFQLGGHSLRATVLISRIHKELNARIPLTEIFNKPTIRELARCIRGAVQERFTSIHAVEKREYYALTPTQMRFYLIQQLEPGNVAFNIPRVIPLIEEFDKEKLEQTFKQLIQRHDALRTSFEIVNGVPVQRIYDNVEFEIDYYDLTAKTREETRRNNENHHPFFITRNFIRPFNLSQAPLLRVELVTGSDRKRFLLVDMHHLISDGSSHQVLNRDYMSLYRFNPKR